MRATFRQSLTKKVKALYGEEISLTPYESKVGLREERDHYKQTSREAQEKCQKLEKELEAMRRQEQINNYSDSKKYYHYRRQAEALQVRCQSLEKDLNALEKQKIADDERRKYEDEEIIETMRMMKQYIDRLEFENQYKRERGNHSDASSHFGSLTTISEVTCEVDDASHVSKKGQNFKRSQQQTLAAASMEWEQSEQNGQNKENSENNEMVENLELERDQWKARHMEVQQLYNTSKETVFKLETERDHWKERYTEVQQQVNNDKREIIQRLEADRDQWKARYMELRDQPITSITSTTMDNSSANLDVARIEAERDQWKEHFMNLQNQLETLQEWQTQMGSRTEQHREEIIATMHMAREYMQLLEAENDMLLSSQRGDCDYKQGTPTRGDSFYAICSYKKALNQMREKDKQREHRIHSLEQENISLRYHLDLFQESERQRTARQTADGQESRQDDGWFPHDGESRCGLLRNDKCMDSTSEIEDMVTSIEFSMNQELQSIHSLMSSHDDALNRLEFSLLPEAESMDADDNEGENWEEYAKKSVDRSIEDHVGLLRSLEHKIADRLTVPPTFPEEDPDLKDARFSLLACLSKALEKGDARSDRWISILAAGELQWADKDPSLSNYHIFEDDSTVPTTISDASSSCRQVRFAPRISVLETSGRTSYERTSFPKETPQKLVTMGIPEDAVFTIYDGLARDEIDMLRLN